MGQTVFLDTAYAIALASPADDYHVQALQLADQLDTVGTRLVTTHAILVEIGNALAKQRNRRAAVQLLRAINTDPKIDVVPVSEDLYIRALNLYQQRLDKEWGLTDCISFIVMLDQQITDALTADKHFQQAGFRTLLRPEDA